MSQSLTTQHWAPFPVELVFAFFANPSNLPHLMPPEQKVRVEDARLKPPPERPLAVDPGRRFRSLAAGEGSEILVSFRPVSWIPQRVSWLTRITEFAWNSHFCDEQVRGPFASFHHRHGIVAETREGIEGTLVSDEIEFDLPHGVWGRLAGPMARRRLESAFAYRQKRLAEILEAAARQAARRA